VSRPVGLWRRLLWDNGAVIDSAWREALAAGQFVGSCRQPRCGGNLKPGHPYEVGHVVWYPARCTACDAEPSAPGPKPVKAKKGAA
jgi:hypothetical protein